jgi:carbonic anhydrase
MLTRRMFCGCLPLAAIAAGTYRAHAAPSECAVFTADMQKSVSPDDAIARLKAGNERFVSGKTVNCDLMLQVKETAKAQAPFAAIVGCIDSRVPPEFVFDQRIGDVFCARVAGNFVNTDIIGSLEFATRLSGARAIVVLGHSSCGAIKGAIDDAQLGNLTATLSNIRPAVELAESSGERVSSNKAFEQAVAIENVRLAMAMLTERSAVLDEMVKAGDLRIAGAMHDIATGKVTFLE